MCLFMFAVFLTFTFITQVYERFDAESIAEVDDARLEYFTKKVCVELLLRVIGITFIY